MLSTNVLILNRHYLPVNVTTVRRAFCLLYQGVGKVVDNEFNTFDFESWAELSVKVGDDSVGLIGRMIRVPRVMVLTAYDRLPKKGVKFSRINILLRDHHTCQYCGRHLPRNQLNLDHIVPRSRGGLTSWENVVTSCHECNCKKGGRTPLEANMKLVQKPFKPTSIPFWGFSSKKRFYEEWKPFINFVDYSYWNVELEP